jgi:hypothetical protein
MSGTGLYPSGFHFCRMSKLLEDPDHWRHRAEEARLLADQLNDPEAKLTMQQIAEAYELLAKRALQRKWPGQGTKPGGGSTTA